MPDIGEYKYGFSDRDVSIFRSGRGLTKEIVEEISRMKEEPQWMLDFRLKSLEQFYKMPMPQWGGDLSELNFDDITYYVKASDKTERSWDEVPEEIKTHLTNWAFQKQNRNTWPAFPLNTSLKWFTTT